MSQRKVQQPTEKSGYRDETVYEHPAYAMIGASRGSNTPGVVLFGTDFRHNNSVRIRIQTASLHRDLSKDWPCAEKTLVEVELSEAQWARFVSAMNVGAGVQCTLRYVTNGQGGLNIVPELPFRQQTTEFDKEVKETLSGMADLVAQTMANITGELGTGISNKKKEAILEQLTKLRQDISSNLPFVAESFDRHMEKVTEQAKIEVNAYAQNALMRAGAAALTNGAQPPIQIGSGEQPDE